MKNKKILSLVLAATMCLTMLTGCGAKPEEEFITLLDGLSNVTEGTVDATVTINIPKETLETLSKTDEEASEEVMMEFDTDEALKDLVDENGNLKMAIDIDAKYNKDEQVDMTIGMFDESINAIVDDKDVYLEIDGLFDILETVIGEEVSLIKMFLGEDVEYIKTTTETEEEKETPEAPEVKKYVTKDNVTKEKDGSYIAKLGNAYVEEALTDELKENLDISSISNSVADMKIYKDKKASDYKVDFVLNIENKISCTVSANVIPGDITIELPADDKVLDTEDESDMSFGFDEEIELDPSDIEVETSEGVDFEWTVDEDTNSTENSDDDYSWEDFDSIELDYDFTSASEYAFDFVTETADFKDSAVAERYNTVKSQIETVLGNISPDMIYDTNTSSDKDWNSYSANYDGDFEKFDEEFGLYLSDEYVSFEVSYYFGKDYDEATLNAISERIEETTGLIVPASELNTWIQNLLSQYKEEYWSMSAYAEYDDVSFDIYVWDGEDINITVERSKYNY